ncbi:MAG: PPC domain-containing protein, partial [Planctomycetota bacterium]
NTTKDAQLVSLPTIINGQINTAGDVDVFKFKGRGGDKIVAEVYGRRLNSPVDSFLRLTNDKGTTLEWNDDYVEKDGHLHKDVTGLVTHHADSYLMTALPETGTYYVHLSDSQKRGGNAYGYRLRISEPQSDFALRLTPSSLATYPGGTVVVQVYALRKDGFDGEINIVLKDAPEGFKLEGGRIPAGCNKIRMTVTTPRIAPATPVSLELQGGVVISNHIVTRPVVPADDIMQAFLYRHLVPAKQLLVSVQKGQRRMPRIEPTGSSPVRLAAGGSTTVRMRTPKRSRLGKIQLQLNQPPQGLTMHDVKVVSGTLSFTLKADKGEMKTGLTDNLIIEAFREFTPKQKGKKNAKKKRVSIGFLPAIPIQIVN